MTTLALIIRWVVGVLFIVAGVAKLLGAPGVVVAAMTYVIAPENGSLTWISPAALEVAVRILAVLLITSEAALGTLLLLSGQRRWRLIAAGSLLFFAVVLAVRFTVPGAPPCGCMGISIRHAFRLGVWFDVGRNLLLAAALLLSLNLPLPWNRRLQQRPIRNSDQATASGFTLVETLVVILLFGVLAALIVPSLAASRTAARVTRSLSTQRQIAAAITSYAAAGKDRLPNFGSAGGLGGTISVGGSAFRNGYFRTHMTAWPYLVCPTDTAMLGALRNPNDERVLEDTNPTHHTTLFYMTATASADVILFDGAHSDPIAVAAKHLRAVHLAEFVSPSKKGLTIDMYMRELSLGKRANISTLSMTAMDIVGFADGSAEKLAASDGLPAPVSLDYVGIAATRVLTTRGGAAGRDR